MLPMFWALTASGLMIERVRSMWRSWRWRGVYLAAGATASVPGLAACDAPPPGGDDTGAAAAAVLVPLAQADLLLPLSTAPADAWRFARAWSAAGGACPIREDVGAGTTLAGPCTLADGRELTGRVVVDEVPDGGTWTFDAVTVGGLGLDGTVSWVRTDGANTLTAWEFTGALGAASATYGSFVATLHDGDDTWLTAAGSAGWRDGDAEARADATLRAAIDCAQPGEGAWTAAEESVTAGLAAGGCGCTSWRSDGAAGEWCDG